MKFNPSNTVHIHMTKYNIIPTNQDFLLPKHIKTDEKGIQITEE